MKHCDQIQPLLIDFVDKTLSEENTSLVREHLKSCPSCREEADELVILFGEMEKTENELPDIRLSQDFHAMLEAEKENSAKMIRMNRSPQTRWFRSNLGQIAAAVALLVTGIFIGSLLNQSVYTGNEVAEIKKEMNTMKELLILSKLEQPVASERIIAAGYLHEGSTPDSHVLQALINTMNNDENTNVRMAAMNALAKFKNEPLVADAMVESLPEQTDPIIQISLINILVEMQDTRAVGKMKQIINDNSTNESVKKLAEEGILTLI